MLEARVCALLAQESNRRTYSYARRRPELSALHVVVRENVKTLHAAIEQGFVTPLPEFVKKELEEYVDCGVLARGFALLACPDCDEQKLVAFSCGGRGFCPSCGGRRMAQTAANLVDHVLPEGVPLRQYVLTLPFELRARIAYDRELMGAVGRIFVDTVLGFYERKSRERGIRDGESGAFTVVQRVSSDLRLNPHYHSVFLDGVFAPGADGKPEFHPLGSLSNGELADLMQAVRIRVLGYLERQGIIESKADLTSVDDDFAEREPSLAALARASVSGLAPAGPERRTREPVALRGEPGVELKSGLNVSELGFSLHAATVVGAHDRDGREGLCKYVLRPPIATERVELLPDGLVRLTLKRPWRDGTVAVDLDPLSLLVRLCATVPPPKMHLVRYAGVLGSAHRWRPLVVPPLPASPDAADSAHAHARNAERPTHRCHYWRWAALLKRSLGIDGDKCDRCGAKMKLRALVIAAASIERLLRHLGEPADPPVLSPARGPPFFKSPVVRRKLGELDVARGQVEMFEA